jgi:hypothetical protein
MMNLMHKDYTWFENYTTQYLDVLNCRFIQMDPEKRLKSIPIMAKRLSENNEEYLNLKEEVTESARFHNTYEDNILPPIDYPEKFEW